jgi:uncharacterized membrane protein
MPNPILYLGDTSLSTAACYLAGIMHDAGLHFDYKPSHERTDSSELAGRKLVIVSDYPASRLDDKAHYALAMAIKSGTGLLMLGGWESYHGLGGDWDATSIAPLLPVNMSKWDDRVNGDTVAFLRATSAARLHPTTGALPWAVRPPVVGGWSRFSVKPGAQVLLEVVPHTAICQDGEFSLTACTAEPLLVVQEAQEGQGRIACLATDAAPHWVGPWVDWGTDNTMPSGSGRIKAQAPGSEAIEVGILYASFFKGLVSWVAAV